MKKKLLLLNSIIQVLVCIAMIVMALADIQPPKIILAIFAVCNIITAISILSAMKSAKKDE